MPQISINLIVRLTLATYATSILCSHAYLLKRQLSEHCKLMNNIRLIRDFRFNVSALPTFIHNSLDCRSVVGIL